MPHTQAMSPTQEDPWAAWAQAGSAAAWHDAWLQVLLLGLLKARAGVLLLAQADGSFAPAAAWPPGRDVQYLADIATEALRERQAVIRHDALGHARVASPLLQVEIGGEPRLIGGNAEPRLIGGNAEPRLIGGNAEPRLIGAVVADLGEARQPTPEQALQWLHWGSGWLLEQARSQQQAQAAVAAQATAGHGEFVLHTLMGLLAEPGLRQGALKLSNQLAAHLQCRQVWLAWVPGAVRKGRLLQVAALSNNAEFVAESQEVQSALQAMHEAFDQRSTVQWPAPAPEDAAAAVGVAHGRHAQATGAAQVLSLPLLDGPAAVGVLMLERQAAWQPQELHLLQALASALAPWLQLRQQADEGLAARWRRQWRAFASALGGSRYPALKLGTAAASLLLLVLALWPATLRVSGRAVVEGAVQRAVVAPFEGYLREAPVRAGDAVKAGQVMAVLDDKDLRLERTRWDSELEVAQRKEREAMSAGHRVNQRLAAAQANQARANLDLVLAKLERVQVAAPFDGTVVKGDLSQQLGSPLEQGKVLFEVAPLDAWRVVLLVDERDIALVREGAAGELRLSSLPGQAQPFTVRRIMPTATAQDGRNLFRVEAALGAGAPRLSPNMEGAAKVEAGSASLLWAWCRPLVQWAQLALWKLMP